MISRGVRGIFLKLFFDGIPVGEHIASDGTPCSAASHLGLYCLPMSQRNRTPGSYG